MLTICTAYAEMPMRAKVVRVADGDTIEVFYRGKVHNVHLYGIKTPELTQDYGLEAKQYLTELVHAKSVFIDIITFDTYKGRSGIVKIGGQVINEELICKGYGWVNNNDCNRQECQEWKAREFYAKKAKLNLWSSNHLKPSEEISCHLPVASKIRNNIERNDFSLDIIK
jgi:endonuclease YncB( thermonuclease family)